MKITPAETCSWPDCTKPPRGREKPTGPAPTRCDEHSARRAERYRPPPRPAPAAAPLAPLLPGRERRGARRELERQRAEGARDPLAGPGRVDVPRMHCPNDGCDAVVEVSGVREDAPSGKQAIGAAWRGRGGQVVVPGEEG